MYECDLNGISLALIKTGLLFGNFPKFKNGGEHAGSGNQPGVFKRCFYRHF